MINWNSILFRVFEIDRVEYLLIWIKAAGQGCVVADHLQWWYSLECCKWTSLRVEVDQVVYMLLGVDVCHHVLKVRQNYCCRPS